MATHYMDSGSLANFLPIICESLQSAVLALDMFLIRWIVWLHVYLYYISFRDDNENDQASKKQACLFQINHNVVVYSWKDISSSQIVFKVSWQEMGMAE